jgi:putative Mn2+ efflux pump MntP
VLALLLLALALGLDNLAAAIGFGVGGTGRVSGGTRVRIAVVFGLFEAGMPVLGLLLGHGLADSIGTAARWLGGAALVAFGVTGLVRSWRDSGERAPPPQRTGRLLLTGLVLSGDNLAAGFALGAYHAGIVLAAVVFGVVIGAAAGERSELIACALLIAVGAIIATGVL